MRQGSVGGPGQRVAEGRGREWGWRRAWRRKRMRERGTRPGRRGRGLPRATARLASSQYTARFWTVSLVDRRNRSWVTSSFVTRSATYSPTAGPCLKPWPDPPPAIQTLSKPGWRSMTKSPFEVFSYWQTGSPRRARPSGRGNAGPRRPAPWEPPRSTRRSPRVGIDGVPVAHRRRDLEAAALEVGDAVELLAEVDPGGQGGRGETRVARGHAEEEDLLAGGKDPAPEGPREHAAEPWATREDEGAGPDVWPARVLSSVRRPRPGGKRRKPRRSRRPNGRRRGPRLAPRDWRAGLRSPGSRTAKPRGGTTICG